jgi:Zn-dependent protease with chaperone function
MIGAVEDILFHVKRINAPLRILLVGVAAFAASELLYGSRGQDSGPFQFIMYGLVGFIPATISAWLVHRYVEEPQPVQVTSAT